MSDQEPKVPFTQKLKASAAEWKRHATYFQKLVKDDPSTALKVWKATYKEQEALQEAVNTLSQRSNSENFEWVEVPRVLGNFTLQDDDQGQADWYNTAHHHYHTITQKLEQGTRFKPPVVEPLMKELRYISGANEFHQKFQLIGLQERIRAMYDNLLQRIDEHNALHKAELQQKTAQSEIEKIKAQEALVAAENEKLAQQNRLVQEQRIKAVEEKKRLEAKRAADEAEQQRLEKQREYDAEAAQRRRQEELQASFRDLNLYAGSGGASAPVAAPPPPSPPVPTSVDKKIDALIEQLTTQDSLSDAEIAATTKLYEMLRAKFGG